MTLADFILQYGLQVLTLAASALAAVLTMKIRLAITEARLDFSRDIGKVTHEIGQLELRTERRITALETRLSQIDTGRRPGGGHLRD